MQVKAAAPARSPCERDCDFITLVLRLKWPLLIRSQQER